MQWELLKSNVNRSYMNSEKGIQNEEDKSIPYELTERGIEGRKTISEMLFQRRKKNRKVHF